MSRATGAMQLINTLDGGVCSAARHKAGRRKEVSSTWAQSLWNLTGGSNNRLKKKKTTKHQEKTATTVFCVVFFSEPLTSNKRKKKNNKIKKWRSWASWACFCCLRMVNDHVLCTRPSTTTPVFRLNNIDINSRRWLAAIVQFLIDPIWLFHQITE